MYAFDIPADICTELCRLLDFEEYWKELAQKYYSTSDILSLDQTAKRFHESPTKTFLVVWGQEIYSVDELFLNLYKMRHIPALNCIRPLVPARLRAQISRKLKNKSLVVFDSSSTGNVFPSILLLQKQSNEVTHSCLRSIPSTQSLRYPSTITQSGSFSMSCTASARISNTLPPREEQNNNIEVEGISLNVSDLRRISYGELRVATGDWAVTNYLGGGGFGVVFKGEWKFLPVAVKKLKESKNMIDALRREMSLNKYRHDNILPLYGYSFGGEHACLVYQYMAGGSLGQRLRATTCPPLIWPQRHAIALGVASGLYFLHYVEQGSPLIHGDIKPPNILLDHNLVPKIGDFGLARKGEGKNGVHVNNQVFGTKEYMANEYRDTHILSAAVDVFSFGVVMLEIATALPPRDKTTQKLLTTQMLHLYVRNVDMATQEDPLIRGTSYSYPKMCRDFIDIGLICTEVKKKRPNMLTVFKKIKNMNNPYLIPTINAKVPRKQF